MAVSSVLQHNLFRTSSLLLFKPLCIKATTTFHLGTAVHTLCSSRSSLPRSHFSCNSSSPSLTFPQTFSSHISHEDQVYEEQNEDEEKQIESLSEEVKLEISNGRLETSVPSSTPARIRASAVARLPILSVKEKKELVSYAHGLGKKLKCQQVGKSGVNSSVAASFIETLESKELLKKEAYTWLADLRLVFEPHKQIKVHNSCPGELADVVKQLEEETGSVAVGQIGRTVILYRPSLTKLKAEEKKNHARKVFMRKKLSPKSTELLQKKGQALRLTNRGHRGSSRV